MSAVNPSIRIPNLSNFDRPEPVVGSRPSARSVRRWEAALGRFHEELRAWDAHLDRCPTCLHQGTWFCAEGECQVRIIHASRTELGGLAVVGGTIRAPEAAPASGPSGSWERATHSDLAPSGPRPSAARTPVRA